ncbi:hypothetical protein BKM32_04230 [Mangrovimonas sp. DI 80]|nr:hypothetical protein BKM32_04230 [Mangrovimonas sp. DI 80]
MSKYEIPRRLSFIIQYLKDRETATKEELLQFLEEKDCQVSERTFERDLSKIRTDFGLEISYQKGTNSYYIDHENSMHVASFFRFIEFVTLADVFTDGLKDSRDIFGYVHFDDSNQLKGLDNLVVILRGIKEGRQLSFTHYNYYNDTHKAYTITPLIIKEYLNRWYVIGVPEGMDEIRSFGIDRMEQTKLTGLSKIKTKDFEDQLAQFDNIIGLNYSRKNQEEIVLKVNNNHLKYLESLPLHSSQQVVPDTEEGFSRVSYHLIPNYELDIQIFKMSLEVEVVAPQWYREHIKNAIEQIYKKYK